VQYLCDLIDPHSGNFYTFEQIRNKLNTNNFLKYFDQFVISQLRSFSHLENFSVGKEMIAFTRPL
jgi:phage terminase large subunit-like protein